MLRLCLRSLPCLLGVLESSLSVLQDVLLREVLRNADMLVNFAWVPYSVHRTRFLYRSLLVPQGDPDHLKKGFQLDTPPQRRFEGEGAQGVRVFVCCVCGRGCSARQVEDLPPPPLSGRNKKICPHDSTFTYSSPLPQGTVPYLPRWPWQLSSSVRGRSSWAVGPMEAPLPTS